MEHTFFPLLTHQFSKVVLALILKIFSTKRKILRCAKEISPQFQNRPEKLLVSLHLILHKEKRLRAAVFFSLTIGTIGTFHFLSDGPFLLGPQPFVIICIKASEWTLPSVVTDSNTLTFIFLIGFILVLYWFSSSRGIHQSSTNLVRTFVQFHEKGRTAHCKRFSFDGKKLQPQQCKKMYLQRLSCKAFSAPNVKHWPFGKFLLLLFQECSSSFYHCTPKKTWEEEDQDTIWKGGINS